MIRKLKSGEYRLYSRKIRDLPGDLDDAGKLTLARRLIREGLLVTSLT